MKRIHLLSKLVLVGIVFLLLVTVAFAQGEDFELPNPLEGTNSISQLIAQVFNAIVVFVAPPVAAVMIVIGSFFMMTAAGDPQKYERGKKTIFYTVIGLIVVILGSLIAQLIAEILGAPPEVIDAFESL